MMFMRSCTPLTPWGILVKSSLPMAFCLVLKGRWSEATMFNVSLWGDRAGWGMALPGLLGVQNSGNGVPLPRGDWGAQCPGNGAHTPWDAWSSWHPGSKMSRE